MSLLEKSQQEIPQTPETIGLPAPSVPLRALEEQAPEITSEYGFGIIRNPFSNDEAAAYYEQLQARVCTEDYRNASNRTAIIIGEGYLISALPYIEEDTIILLDNSAPMLAFMKDYIESLRTAGDIHDWGRKIGINGSEPGTIAFNAMNLFFDRTEAWATAGHPSAVQSDEHFETAQELARQKAIVPWLGDITSEEDMARLGKALQEQGANVTFMNISNVLPDAKTFETAEEFVQRLRLLPITTHAPIMTTSTMSIVRQGPLGQSTSKQATGPFFGLDNLAEHGGNVSIRATQPGAVVIRNYLDVPEGKMMDGVPISFLVNLMAGSIIKGDDGKKAVVLPAPNGDRNVAVMPVDDIPPRIREIIKV